MCRDHKPREPWTPTCLLLTCEHGGRDVPPPYRRYFRGAADVLRSHRGYDIGALGVARRMAERLAAPLICSTTTRLLVELNRSIGQPDHFSEYTATLPEDVRRRIIDEHYTPYRRNVETTIAAAIHASRRVLHVSVHSCADELDGTRRDLDIALLLDESRHSELSLCQRWRDALHEHDPTLRCPFNEPYKGTDDGLTTTLRTRFAPTDYAGVELEIRQGMITRAAEQRAWGDVLAETASRVM